MTVRATLRFAMVATTVWLAGCEQAPPPHIENVLIIMTEDQGAHASYLGTPGVETPTLDDLARSGASFREAFAASPVCSPSKAALYTGRPPHANGLTANTVDFMRPAEALATDQRRHPLYGLYRIDDDVPTLIEAARDAGLYTGVTGKLHVAPNEKFPFDRFLRTRGEPGAGPAAVAQFIEEAAEVDRPWLLVHSIKPPHRPFPDSDLGDIGIDIARVEPPGFLPPTQEVRRDWAEYLAAVQRADAELAAALDALRASGEADRTLVVFTSDHGPAFQRGKMSLYPLGLRVPLIFSGPGVEPALYTEARVGLIDVMPTVLEMLDIASPPGVQGRSLAPLLRGEADDAGLRGRVLYAELFHGIPRPERGMQERAVHDGTWHLIHRVRPRAPRIVNNDLRRFEKWGNRTYGETLRGRDRYPEAWRMLSEIDNGRLGGRPPRIELYRSADDPDALNDLARDPEHRETLDRLLAALRRHAEVPEAADSGEASAPPRTPAVDATP